MSSPMLFSPLLDRKQRQIDRSRIALILESWHDDERAVSIRNVLQQAVNGTFLNNKDIKEALQYRGKIHGFVDLDNLDKGFRYGQLGEKISAFLTAVHGTNAANLSPHETSFLDYLTKTESEIGNDNLRAFLLEFLVIVAGLAYGLDDAEGPNSHIFTKQFVRFLLDKILPFKKSKKFYFNFLSAIGSHVSDDQDANEFDMRELAAKEIVRALVGNDRMRSVVAVSRARSLAILEKPKSYKMENPKILIKSMHAFARENWGTDDLAAKSTLSDEFLAFTGHALPRDDDATTAITATNGTDTNGLAHALSDATPSFAEESNSFDDVAGSEQLLPQINLVLRQAWQSLIMHENGTPLSPQDIHKHRQEITTLKTGLASFGGLTVETATLIDSSNGGNDNGDRVSPLTVHSSSSSSIGLLNNRFGSADNGGLSITPQALAYCLQQLRERGDGTLRRHLDRNWQQVPEAWKVPIDPPATNDEIALVGGKYTEKDFWLLQVLGGGSFGRVFQVCLRSDPAKRAALKVVYFNVENFCKYFAGELVDGTRVKSLHVIRVLGYFCIDSIRISAAPMTFGILLEECVHSLKTVISRGCSLIESCNIIWQVLTGVRDFHEQDVTHRDIKPGNVCLGKDGWYKLIDCGLAKHVDEDGTLTEDVGTSPYIPPVGRGAKHDEFSTAIVWYELVTGKVPGTKHLRREVVSAAFHTDNAEAGELVIDLFMHLVEPDDAKRWTANRALPALQKIGQSFGVEFPMKTQP